MFSFLKKKKQDPKAQLRKVLGDYELPSFPGVVLDALAELRNPDGSSRTVARIVATDPKLTIRVLKLVNSGAGAVRRIDNVQQAVALAGSSNLESVLLAAGVRSSLPSSSAPGFDAARFWHAAARRASTARGYAQILHPATAMQSFTASLLQDMAVPMLAHRRPDDYGRILEAWHGGEGDLDELEQSDLGWHHGEVATWLCDEWSLPEGLAQIIGDHHDDAGVAPAGVALVSRLRETEENPGIDEMVAFAEERFGVAPDQSVAIVHDAFDEAGKLAKQLAA
jgi:HD-like signal output (HDOD) protein